jgi:hypothetical protein
MDTVNDRIRYSEYFHAVLRAPRMGSHPGVRSATWCPAWGTRSVHMGLTLAHPAHSRSALTRACEEGARAHACVRKSVHWEPLPKPSRSDASTAPQKAALGFEVAAARFECCADKAPREAAHLRCARGTDRCMLSSMSWLRGTCDVALSPPVLAGLAGMTAVDGLHGKC